MSLLTSTIQASTPSAIAAEYTLNVIDTADKVVVAVSVRQESFDAEDLIGQSLASIVEDLGMDPDQVGTYLVYLEGQQEPLQVAGDYILGEEVTRIEATPASSATLG